MYAHGPLDRACQNENIDIRGVLKMPGKKLLLCQTMIFSDIVDYPNLN